MQEQLRRRDKDYRGQETTVDWSKLVHHVRTRKPGALEVLQDAINIYFPQQFEAAKREANRRAFSQALYYGRTRFYVGFNARRARERFLPFGTGRPADESPFVVHEERMIRTSQPSYPIAYVYATSGATPRVDPRTEILPSGKEREALRPRYTGSYVRPKLPILYFEEFEAPYDDEDQDPVEVRFYVRGPEAVAWVQDRVDILGEEWEVEEPDFAFARIIDPGKDWRRQLRDEGYRNRLEYLPETPSRGWAQGRSRNR